MASGRRQPPHRPATGSRSPWASRKLLLINKFYHDRARPAGSAATWCRRKPDLAAAGWEVIPLRWPTPTRAARPGAGISSAPATTRTPLGGGGARRCPVADLEPRGRPQPGTPDHQDRPDGRPPPQHLPPPEPVDPAGPAPPRHPVVMTLHDLRLLCPAIHMLRDGQVCERCRGGLPPGGAGRLREGLARGIAAGGGGDGAPARTPAAKRRAGLPVPQPLLPGEVRAVGFPPGETAAPAEFRRPGPVAPTACRPPRTTRPLLRTRLAREGPAIRLGGPPALGTRLRRRHVDQPRWNS